MADPDNPNESSTPITVVLGVLIDIHSNGLIVLERALQNEGYKTVFIGANADQEDFIKAAQETAARVILISTASGHALMDCEGFRDKCDEAGLGNVMIYIGGNLIVGKQQKDLDWNQIRSDFDALRFDRVYFELVPVRQVLADLNEDLERQRH